MLLGVMTLPLTLGGTEGTVLRIAAEELANELRLAQHTAMTHGQPIWVHFSGSLNRVRFTFPDDSPVKEPLHLPPGVQFAMNPATGSHHFANFYFNTQGVAVLPAHWLRPRITGNRGELYEVVIDPFSGRIRVARVP